MMVRVKRPGRSPPPRQHVLDFRCRGERLRSLAAGEAFARRSSSRRALALGQEFRAPRDQVVHPADDLDGLLLFQVGQDGASPPDALEAQQDVGPCDRVTYAAFLLDFAPSKAVVVRAGFTRASNPVKLPISTLSIAPLIAPHAVCPKTRSTLAPDTAHANSRLPSRSSFTTFPRSSFAASRMWPRRRSPCST